MVKMTIFTDEELKAMLNDEVVVGEDGREYMSMHYFDKTYLGQETRKPTDVSELARINNMLNVIANEKKCIEKQVNGMCDNKRDCGNCELRMDDNLILEAYTHITELINERLEEIKNGRVV